MAETECRKLNRICEPRGDAFISYRGWCEANDCTPVDTKAFGARLDELRDELGLKVRTKGQDVFFVDLKLAS